MGGSGGIEWRVRGRGFERRVEGLLTGERRRARAGGEGRWGEEREIEREEFKKRLKEGRQRDGEKQTKTTTNKKRIKKHKREK